MLVLRNIPGSTASIIFTFVAIVVFNSFSSELPFSEINSRIISNVSCPPYTETWSLELEEEGNYPVEVGEGQQVESGSRNHLIPEDISVIAPFVYGYPANKPLKVNYYTEVAGGYGIESGETLPVRFYALHNEQFIILNEDGKTPYRDLELPLQNRVTIAFELPPLSEGIHDLIVFGIPNYTEAPDMISDMSSIWTFTRRNTIVVGNPASITSRQHVLLPQGRILPDEPQDSRRVAIIFSLTDRSTALWGGTGNIAQLPAGEDYSFNVQIGQNDYFADYEMTEPVPNQTTPFALLLLKDYLPVPLGDDTLAFYGEMDNDSLFVQVSQSDSVPTSGQTDLMAIRIDYPGVPMCQWINWAKPGVDAIRVIVGAEE